jgi:hypothetical protein
LNAHVSQREKFKALAGALALACLVVVLGPPAVKAATQTVKVKGNVKIVGTDGTPIESEVIPPMGLLQAEGSDGALAVRTFAGGGGFIDAGDCTAETEVSGLPNEVSVSNAIVTGIIITGTDGKIQITSAAIGGGTLPLVNFRVNEANPNEFVGLGNGLTLTAPLTFSCTGEGGGDGDANFVLLGQ